MNDVGQEPTVEDCCAPGTGSGLDRMAALATRLLDVPVAVIGIDPEGPGEEPRWAMAVADPSALRAARAVEHPRLLANPAIAGEFFAFHTTEQLPGRDGMPIGALHVMDHRTHAFTDRDHEVLRYLAGLTAEQVSAGRLIRRLSRADVALRTVSADVAARTGDEFFRALVAQLTRTLNVDYAFVAELAEGKNERAQVIAFSADGTVIEGAEYDLRGTPCRDVIRGEVCSVSLGVRQVYPEDRLLTELGVESYVGMTLCCGEGGRIGWLAVMDRAPVADLALTESVLRLFAARAAAELERRRAESALRRAHAEMEQRVAERTSALRLEEEKFSKAFRSSPDPMAIAGAEDGRFLEVNDAFLDQVGYARNEVIGRTALELNVWAEPDERARMLRLLRTDRVVRNFEFEYRRRTGERRMAQLSAELIEIRAETCILAVVHDVTAAFHDELTGLPNRALLLDRLGRALERAKRHPEHRFAVMFIDLDRFKMVNDSLGHAAGDRLIVSTAQTLHSCLRPEDTVARLGGDEFAVILEDLTGNNDPTRVAERIRQALALPVDLDGQTVFPSASTGIAVGTGGYARAEDLLRDADTALYRAKALGRNRYEVFDAEMHAEAVAQLRLESELRQAVDRQEFRLEYQPIVALDDDRIVGFEALLRWQHPVRGLVYPAEFLEVAEETGLIVPIGWWVLREACAQLRRWQERFPDPPSRVVSVNLCSRQFIQPDLVERIQDVLQETGADPRSLMLEITESVIMDNADAVTNRLSRLRDLSIKLSIDDFGTGYSSLSYLHRFPIDTLKIDRSFIGRIGAGGENLEIVRTIVTLAHNLAKSVIAEGVETREQLMHLRALACDFVQGHYFSRTIDPEAALALLTP